MVTPEPLAQESTKAEPTKSESKDFVEHLRTIHFTLLAACTALVVIVLAGGSSKYQKAEEQVNDISDAAQKWSTGWLQEAALEELKRVNPSECGDAPVQRFVTQVASHTMIFELGGQSWNLFSPNSVHMAVNYRRGGNVDYNVSTPETLQAFKENWDSIFSIVCPSSLDLRRIWTIEPYGVWQAYPIEVLKTKNEGETISLTFRQNSGIGEPPPPGLHQEAYTYTGLSHKDFKTYVIPALVKREGEVRFRDAIAHNLSRTSWRNVSFHDQFRELDNLTNGFQDLDFKHLRDILYLQERTSQEVFEAFGIKFPIESTTRWGITIVMAIQLYLWMHLSEYNKRQVKAVEVAWIGTYSGIAPRIVFVITALVLPVVVIALLGFKVRLGLSPGYDIILAILATAVSVHLAYKGWGEHSHITI